MRSGRPSSPAIRAKPWQRATPPSTTGRRSSVSTPARRPSRRLSSTPTGDCSTATTGPTTATRCRSSVISSPPSRPPTPTSPWPRRAPPATANSWSRAPSTSSTRSWRRWPTTRVQMPSSMAWISSSISAGRTSSASRSPTGSSTTSSSMRPAPPDAVHSCRPSPTPWATPPRRRPALR